MQAQRIAKIHGENTMSIIEADPYKAMVDGAVNFRCPSLQSNVAFGICFVLKVATDSFIDLSHQ